MRREDWPERLNRVIEQARGRRFAWGAHDCVTFAADCVRAMTDDDPLELLRGAYEGAAGAARLLAGMGGMQAAVGTRLGQPVPPARARRGDVVLFESARHGQTLGVCVGAALVGPGEAGLLRLPMSQALLAWPVD